MEKKLKTQPSIRHLVREDLMQSLASNSDLKELSALREIDSERTHRLIQDVVQYRVKSYFANANVRLAFDSHNVVARQVVKKVVEEVTPDTNNDAEKKAREIIEKLKKRGKKK
jgi:DNA-binding protein Fis